MSCECFTQGEKSLIVLAAVFFLASLATAVLCLFLAGIRSFVAAYSESEYSRERRQRGRQ